MQQMGFDDRSPPKKKYELDVEKKYELPKEKLRDYNEQ